MLDLILVTVKRKYFIKKVFFYNCDIQDINQLEFISKNHNFDLIFGHSCLEHVEYDITALINLKKIFPKTKQIHISPAALSLMNYYFHGYRRYRKLDLEKISREAGLDSRIISIGNYLRAKSFLESKNTKRLYYFKKLIYLKYLLKLFSFIRKQPLGYILEINE